MILSNSRIYLDNNATTIMDVDVCELMIELFEAQAPYNASSIHQEGRKTRSILEAARQKIANALGIDAYKDEWQVTFTSSGTEANNLAISNYADYTVLVGATEHVSILEADCTNKIIIPVDEDGIILIDKFVKLLELHSGKKLVSVMLANNETGVIENIKQLSEIAHSYGCIFHCDASQALTKIDVDIKDLNCDLLTISAHKCGGPLGTAALVAKKALNLRSMVKGGKQEHGLRAGTENVIAIAGFGQAVKNFKHKIEKYKYIEKIRDYMEQKILAYTPDAKIIAKNVLRLPNTSSIRMPNVKSQEQLIKFDLAGVALSAGSACSSGRIASSYVLKAMNIEEKVASEVIRVSLGLSTNEEQIDQFIALWKKIYNEGNLG